MSSMFVELQTPLSEYSLVCRGCLAESGEMKNIREWGLTEDFCKLTDIMLPGMDGISELLCTACEDTLMVCRRFRTQCQQSDIVLRNIANRKPEEENIQEQTKNTVSFTFNENQLIYCIVAPNTDAKITLPCPYSCNGNYIKKKDLTTHLLKVHNLQKDFKIDVKYFCTDENCSYNECSGKLKWFTERKYLNQHYNKVHKSKIFHCDKCKSNFALLTDFNRHTKTCNVAFKCEICDITYSNNERLLVHLMRHHPDLHKQYKNARKLERTKSKTEPGNKRVKNDSETYDYIFDSPKRSFATQTLEHTIRNDVALPSWQTPCKADFTKTDEISTQTVFEDLLSLKSQSEDDSILFSESVSLSDIQTQTFPTEFGLSRSNKETLTEPDISIKETQTCVCRYDSPKPHFRLFDSVVSSPGSGNLTSTETQTQEFDSPKRSFATQTLEHTIRNDVALPSWQTPCKADFTKTDEISTQTVFEGLLSLKSQSEDDSILFSESVSLSDIQTQTFPTEFGLSRSNKETLTEPDISIKETQTCVCRYDSPKPHFRLFDSAVSSPGSGNLTSTETQTQEFRTNVSDVLLNFNCAETQTCFDNDTDKNCL